MAQLVDVTIPFLPMDKPHTDVDAPTFVPPPDVECPKAVQNMISYLVDKLHDDVSFRVCDVRSVSPLF